MLLFNSIIDTKREAYINFNTSNVTIQQEENDKEAEEILFQYI